MMRQTTGLQGAERIIWVLLLLSSTILWPGTLMANEEISVVILPAGGDAESEATSAETSVTETGSAAHLAISRTGVVTTFVREVTVAASSSGHTGLVLSVWDDRGTVTGWNVGLSTVPAEALVVFADKTDTIARVFPQPARPTSFHGVTTGSYHGPIGAGVVPLLAASSGSGDGVWNQFVEIGAPETESTVSQSDVLLVLDLTFAP